MNQCLGQVICHVLKHEVFLKRYDYYDHYVYNVWLEWYDFGFLGNESNTCESFPHSHYFPQMLVENKKAHTHKRWKDAFLIKGAWLCWDSLATNIKKGNFVQTQFM